ncbi:oligosaccharide flippase family protein [uncultured Eubacterium sp.]|jgi:O-antigen/teichoic acid export membrane protein|uniref:lipopolysaccharide biosynthesis protein n=1 Tax=uncultured Eubacterium sp. TaxID=165185 RepID=UPI0032676B74
MGRTRRAFVNIIWGFIEKMITLICPFIIRTIMIYKLGNEYLGLNGLFTSILQVLSLAELGFGDAIVFSMYKPIIENDNKMLSALLNLYKKVYRIIGMVILCVGLLILPFITKFVKGGYPSEVNIYVLYCIYLFNTVISYFLFAYKESLLKAHQRNDVNSRILSGCNIVMYVLQIIVLLLFSNYYLYIVIMPVTTIVLNCVRSLFVKKMYPQIVCEGHIEKDAVIGLSKRIIGLTLNKLAQVCRNSFDSIIISSFLGLVILARYQNYYYIISALTVMVSIITTAVGAGIGNSIAAETVEKNYSDYKEFLFIYNWIACFCTVCMLCLYQPFIELWVGKSNVLPLSTVILCCIYFYTMKLGDIAAVYRQAAGIWWEDKFRPIVESVVNLAVNIVLVKYIGVDGVLVSTIISIVCINIPWATYVLFKVYFKMSIKEVFFKYIRYFIETTVLCAVVYGICSRINGNLLVVLVVRTIICIGLVNAGLYIISYTKPEFVSAKNRVFRTKKRM